MSRLISRDDQDRILIPIQQWIQDNPDRKVIGFLKDVREQILKEEFMTVRQFEAVRNIIGEEIDWTPEVIGVTGKDETMLGIDTLLKEHLKVMKVQTVQTAIITVTLVTIATIYTLKTLNL